MPKPIEIDFPIEQVNEIAEREAHAKEKFRPILYIHKWWARRLGSVFRTIILYTLLDENAKVLEDNGKWRPVTKEELANPWSLYLKDVDLGGKIVLDPMMGGGTTIVEALRCGCKVVGQELNPVAWFLVKKIVEPVDLDELKKGFKQLEEAVADEIKQYYRTICPHCLKKYAKLHKKEPEEILEEVVRKLNNAGDPREVYEGYAFKDNEEFIGKERNIFADTMYYFWIKEVPCLNCDEIVPLFKSYMLAHNKKGQKTIGYYIICPHCGNIFENKDYTIIVSCPDCETEFNPQDDKIVTKDGGSYTCPHCGQKSSIVETIQRKGKPKERLYAVEYYCPYCGAKDYKQSDEFDSALFEKAKEEYEEVEHHWLGKYIPNTTIPMGFNTKQMINYGYKDWRDMFNERQLLSFGKLLVKIHQLEVSENVRELLLITLSDSLDYNNCFPLYAQTRNHIEHLFTKHAFHPRNDFVENNVFGTKFGRGTFKNEMKKIISGKEYNLHPFEKYINSGKTFEISSKIKITGKLGDIFTNQNANVLITSGDSSYLEIPDDNSLDAVITDPPYYGNVMYSELSEFYYAWLRLALKDKYEYFQSEHVPNATEVIVNNVQGKDEEDFIEGLTAIFKEAGSKLKDDGLMVFTFHHQEEKAWAAVLQSVLNSNFYISAIYPIQSEAIGSTHIFQKASVRYDMVVVCRKRESEPEKKHWSQIEDEIYFKVEDELKRLEKHKRNLSSEDIFVVTIGKCLELYSKYYPEVYQGEVPVSIDKALSSIREIVDSQLMHTRFNQVASETDTLTAIYLFYLTGKTNISFDSLNKALKMRSLPMKDVISAGLVEKEGSQLLVLTPMERKSIIETKRKEGLSAIDRAHYLYYLWKEGKVFDFERTLSEGEKELWRAESVIKTLEYLSEIEKDKTYEDVVKFLKERWLKQKYLEV